MDYKFRGWDVIGHKWVYGDLVHNQKVTRTGLEPRTMVGGYEVAPESVGLWSGLRDKNGNDIYKGDIVAILRKPEKRQRLELVRHVVTCRSVCDWVFESLAYEVCGLMMASHMDFDSYKFEIIGNVFDNPELAQPYSLNLLKHNPRQRNNNVVVELVADSVNVSTTVSQEVTQKLINEIGR